MGNTDMTRKANPETKTVTTKDGRQYYQSVYDYSKKYDKSKDALRIRVPSGMREIIQRYVAETGNYASVNDMVNKLIEDELKKYGYLSQ